MPAPRATIKAGTTTKESLLDAAEALFAEHGIAGASLRAITTRAGANVAAAHYHFGSKKGLARAVLSRHLGPINEERLRLLDAAEAEGEKPDLEALVSAFVAPVVRRARAQPDRGRRLAQIFGRVMTVPDNTLREMLIAELAEVIRRFSAAFARALPHLPQQTLFWRIHFMVGAMAHTLAGSHMIEAVTEGLCCTDDLDIMVDQLVTFLAAGLAAPATATGEHGP